MNYLSNRSFLQTLSTSLISLLILIAGQQSHSSESRFLVNQVEDSSDILLEYRRFDSSFDRTPSMAGGTANTNLVHAEYQRAMGPMTRLTISTGFAQKDVKAYVGASYLDSDLLVQRKGISFTDLEMSLKTANVEPEFTWYYGGVGSISPAAARDPRLDLVQSPGEARSTNNFSGYQTLGGMIGIETYVDKLALGTQFETRVYSDQSIDGGSVPRNSELRDRVIPTLNAFLEFPLLKTVSIGFDAGVTRPDFGLDKMIFGGSDNRFQGKLFSEWVVDRETTAILEFGQASKQFPFKEDQSSMNIGVRKSL